MPQRRRIMPCTLRAFIPKPMRVLLESSLTESIAHTCRQSGRPESLSNCSCNYISCEEEEGNGTFYPDHYSGTGVQYCSGLGWTLKVIHRMCTAWGQVTPQYPPGGNPVLKDLMDTPSLQTQSFTKDSLNHICILPPEPCLMTWGLSVAMYKPTVQNKKKSSSKLCLIEFWR